MTMFAPRVVVRVWRRLSAGDSPLIVTLSAERPRPGWAGERHVALDGGGQFDDYLTMYVEHGKPGQLAPGQFERIAKALADPRRFSLLETIASAEQECPYQSLCQLFPVSKATISHHMKELVQAGLVESEREGQYMHARVRAGVMEAYTAELLRRVGGAG